MRHRLQIFALLLIACGGSSPKAPAQNPSGDFTQGDWTPTNPSPGILYPDTLILGRETEVEVSFHDITLDPLPDIDFGPGIQAGAPALISQTTLHVMLKVAEDAPVGKRDVVVRLGQELILTFKEGLKITPGVQLTPLADVGDMSQGSIAGLDAVNLDGDNEFVCGATGGFFSSALVYFKQSGDLYPFGPQACAPRHMSGVLMWAPRAAANPRVDVINGDRRNPLQTFIGQPVTVKPRDPIALSAGMTLQAQNLDKPMATNLYRMQTEGPAIVRVTYTSASSKYFPALMMFGEKGTFDDLIDWPWPFGNKGTKAFYPVLSDRNKDVYMTYYDGFLGGGDAETYKYDVVTEVITPDRLLPELEPNDTAAGANSLVDGAKSIIVRGRFSADDDSDNFSMHLNQHQKIDIVIDSDTVFHFTFDTFYGDRLDMVKLQAISFDPPQAGNYVLSLRPTNKVTGSGDYTVAMVLAN